MDRDLLIVSDWPSSSSQQNAPNQQLQRVDLHVSEWEYIKHWRQLVRNTLHVGLPSGREIGDLASQVHEAITFRSISLMAPGGLVLEHATLEVEQLVSLLFSRDKLQTHSSIASLRASVQRHGLQTASVLSAIVGVAVYEWVLISTIPADNPPVDISILKFSTQGCTALEEQLQDLQRMRKLRNLDDRWCAAQAACLTERLLGAIWLMWPSSYQHVPEDSILKRNTSLERDIHIVFSKAFKLRLSMALSRRAYIMELFPLGSIYDAGWMGLETRQEELECRGSDTGDYLVTICLFPAVFVVEEGPVPIKHIWAKALVKVTAKH